MLLSRKQKADSLPPEVRARFADEYNKIVTELTKYAIDHQLPAWDEQINSEIVTVIFRAMAKEYDDPAQRNTVSQILAEFEPEINESFRTQDQPRFYQAVSAARDKLKNI